MDTPAENTGEIPAEKPAAPASEIVTAGDLAAPLAETMPQPTAPAGEVKNTQTEIPAVNEAVPPAKPVPEIRDFYGKLFDPTKHKVDASGMPLRNKNGGFISINLGNPGKRKQGEQSGDSPESLTTEIGDSAGSDLPPQVPPGMAGTFQSGPGDQSEIMAEVYLQTAYGLAASFLGDGIRPEFRVEKRIEQGVQNPDGSREPDREVEVVKFTAEGKAEHDSLKTPLTAVLREKGNPGLTPTQIFLVSLGAFIAKKAAKPTVRERLTLLALKVKNLFGKFTKAKIPNA